jgi:hypothetical protein
LTTLSSIETKLKALSTLKQQDILNKFDRLLKSEKKESKTNAQGLFSPTLKHGQVVLVDFVGVGTVLNDQHFAIVWNPVATLGQVQVIPMSSKGDSQHDIGEIDGLREKHNYILYHQVQNVSRKSIRVWKNTKKQISKLNAYQRKQIKSQYRYYQLKEKDLLYKLKFETDGFPISIPAEMLMSLNKTVYSKQHDKHLEIMLPHKQSFDKINLTKIKMSLEQKDKLLSKLTSENETDRQRGKAEIHSLIN